MGLDSVMLLVDVEKHFAISIPDREAEQIETITDFADCVFGKVKVNPGQKCKSQILFYRLREVFQELLNIPRHEFVPGRKLNTLLPIEARQMYWIHIGERMNLKLPELSSLDLDPSKEKVITLFGLKFWSRNKAVTNGTTGDLILWMLSLNHTALIDVKNLCDRHDIERIIIGIISESCGVPIDEIQPHHKICSDLGID